MAQVRPIYFGNYVPIIVIQLEPTLVAHFAPKWVAYNGAIYPIRDNEIDLAYKPIAFTWINSKDGQHDNIVTVRNNDLKGGKVHISNSNGIVVE